MRDFQVWVLIGCLFLGAMACRQEEAVGPSDNKVTDPSDEFVDTSIFGGEWILIDYKKEWLPANLKNRASIKFNRSEQGDVHLATGMSFVNGYSGNFKVDEKNKLISPVGSTIATKMGGTPAENAAEEDYFQNLLIVKSYELVGDYLTLYFGNQEVGYFKRKE
jgi:heat shock protein HslJ